jgi:hypothetical protein
VINIRRSNLFEKRNCFDDTSAESHRVDIFISRLRSVCFVGDAQVRRLVCSEQREQPPPPPPLPWRRSEPSSQLLPAAPQHRRAAVFADGGHRLAADARGQDG